MLTVSAFWEAALIASSLSLDAFTAGFAYGSKNIELPISSVHIISIICGVITGLSMSAGFLLKPYLPERFAVWSAFIVLFMLGIFKFKPENADIDGSKSISAGEAALLAFSLSLDGIAVGFAAALVNTSVATVVFFSLIANEAAILIGLRMGKLASKKIPFNISWLSGILLMCLAVSKIF